MWGARWDFPPYVGLSGGCRRGLPGPLLARASGSRLRFGQRWRGRVGHVIRAIRRSFVEVGRQGGLSQTPKRAYLFFLFRTTYSARATGGLARRPPPVHWAFGNYGHDVIRRTVEHGDSRLTSDCMHASRAGKLRGLI